MLSMTAVCWKEGCLPLQVTKPERSPTVCLPADHTAESIQLPDSKYGWKLKLPLLFVLSLRKPRCVCSQDLIQYSYSGPALICPLSNLLLSQGIHPSPPSGLDISLFCRGSYSLMPLPHRQKVLFHGCIVMASHRAGQTGSYLLNPNNHQERKSLTNKCNKFMQILAHFPKRYFVYMSRVQPHPNSRRKGKKLKEH